ncbi:MAG: T9SS type A sorting domain-containing protein [bacterium]
MKAYLILLIILFSCFYENIYAADYWKKTDGPFGASISCISADENSGDLYISTLTSGVYRKQNNEEKWTSLNDNILKFNSRVNSIYLNNNGDLFALTDSLGILRRKENGNWTSIGIGLSEHLSFKTILKIKDNTFIVGSLGKAIFRSTNGGENWSNYNTGLLPEENINTLSLVKNIVFAGTDRGIFKSSDEGKKWLKINDETGKVNKLFFDEASNELFAVTSKGVFISKDFGINWQWANTGLNEETSVMYIEKFEDKLYISTLTEGLKFSSIDDINWQNVPDNIDAQYVQTMKSFNAQLFFGTTRAFFKFENNELLRSVEGLAIQNVNGFVEIGNVLYSATDIGIYKSSNFGLSWEANNKGLEAVTKITCLISTNDEGIIAGTEKGLYYLENATSTWQKFSNPELNNEKINTLVIDSTGTVYAGTVSKGIWKTSEDRWLQMNGGDIEKQEILSMIVVDSNYIYAGTKENGLYRKAPFDEWRKITTIDIGINNVSSLEFKDEDRMILAATNIGVYRSRDNGVLWAKSMGTLTSQVTSLISLEKDTVFAGLKNVPGIYRTIDNGDTWSGLYDQSGISKYKVTNFFVSKSGFVFAGTKEGGCYRSTGTYKDLKPQPPVLTLIGKNEFCEGEFCVLDAGGGFEKYLWSDGSKARFDTIWSKGYYWVKVQNNFGFEAVSDTVSINVESKPAKPNLLYNGDVLFCPSDAAIYVWYLNDEIIEGASQKTYKPLENGWYKCEIFTELNCSNISEAVRVELTDVNDYYSGYVSVYPNPAGDYTNIDLSLVTTDIESIENISFSILNLMGTEMLNTQVKLGVNQTFKLNLEALSKGMYIIHCKLPNNSYYFKLIKD